MAKLRLALASHDISPKLMNISPGLGAALIAFDPPAGMTSLQPIQTALLAATDHVTVLSAPAALKAGIDVWGKRPETVHVMRALKAEFDPNGVLNPGRYVDQI